jgi:hypothetical protein
MQDLGNFFFLSPYTVLMRKWRGRCFGGKYWRQFGIRGCTLGLDYLLAIEPKFILNFGLG